MNKNELYNTCHNEIISLARNHLAKLKNHLINELKILDKDSLLYSPDFMSLVEYIFQSIPYSNETKYHLTVIALCDTFFEYLPIKNNDSYIEDIKYAIYEHYCYFSPEFDIFIDTESFINIIDGRFPDLSIDWDYFENTYKYFRREMLSASCIETEPHKQKNEYSEELPELHEYGLYLKIPVNIEYEYIDNEDTEVEDYLAYEDGEFSYNPYEYPETYSKYCESHRNKRVKYITAIDRDCENYNSRFKSFRYYGYGHPHDSYSIAKIIISDEMYDFIYNNDDTEGDTKKIKERLQQKYSNEIEQEKDNIFSFSYEDEIPF